MSFLKKFGFTFRQLDKQKFGDLISQDWITLLENAQLIQVKAGQAVVQQGSSPDGMYIVKSGWLRVERAWEGRQVPLARRGPGELLGEMSALDDTAAMASVIAEEDAELYRISIADLKSMLERSPGFATRYYRSLAIHFSGRLREAAENQAQADRAASDGPVPPVFVDPSFMVMV